MQRLAVVGGGPAGLMAAEVASAAGIAVDVYETKGSVGRKFLLAGKGGLNLTHSEESAGFVKRYGMRSAAVERWLQVFDADAVRKWAGELGIETFIGTSGRVFPSDMKAAPLLRNWLRRLRAQGVQFHVRHRCVALDAQRQLTFQTPEGAQHIAADAVVLAMGGGSWPQLGSDGAWTNWLSELGVGIAPLEPANCGFDVEWSSIFSKRYAGKPVKSVKVSLHSVTLQGEFVVTTTGIEGSVIYALSAKLRELTQRDGSATIHLDLTPDIDIARLQSQLSKPRGGRSLTEHLRRSVGVEGVKMGLLYEVLTKDDLKYASKTAAAIKSLPLRVVRPRPLEESISTAGGVRLEELNHHLMLAKAPGVFCAGEMVDWEAPTGGYLLTASFASGRVAGQGAVEWLKAQNHLP